MRLFLIICILLPFGCFAQPKLDKAKNPAKLDSIEYDFTPETFANESLRLPFSKIEILDARFDTSKLGFVYNRKLVNLNYKDFKKIKLSGGISNGLQTFYNGYYKTSLNKTDDKLLIVLKKLWIDNLPNRQITENRKDIVRSSFQDIHVKFEYYLHRGDDYFALTRIDTVYQLTQEIMATGEEMFKRQDIGFLLFTLRMLIEKPGFEKLLDRVETKRRLSHSAIDSFNKKRYMLPVLTASNINEGVFMTVQEFINNAPSVKNFKIENKKLYVDDRHINSRFYWAYTDSSGVHLTNDKKIDMFRIGNTFEFFILDDIYLSKSITGNILDSFFFYPGNGTKYRIVYSPRQIDMETGQIY